MLVFFLVTWLLWEICRAKEDKDKEKKQALDDADLELDLDPSLDWVDGGMGENTWFGDEGGELSDGPSLHSPEM